jgi:hypothetical protein
MAQVNDLSRSLTAFDPISTLVVVVEMSKASWLVSGAVPGVERQPLKKLEPDATALLRLIERWRNEAVRAGRSISRIALAYEAGRDGFWLARYDRCCILPLGGTPPPKLLRFDRAIGPRKFCEKFLDAPFRSSTVARADRRYKLRFRRCA